jgi:uncharacterized membrane protein
MNKYLKESVFFVLIALPYAYLVSIWNELPSSVPIHYNLEGEPNGWSSKTFLVILPAVLGVVIYFLMRYLPTIDPKKKILEMGDKYYTLRFIISFFIALLTVYILYAGKAGFLKDANLLIALLGFLFTLLGNFFQTIRPNYFIGIRTPWTLENEQVWKKTHLFGGRIWTIGGALLIIFSFVIINKWVMMVSSLGVIVIVSLVPIAYSYIIFQKEKRLLPLK